jgi:N-acetylglutamate synthase-like GNAT family acetyltransferase
MVAALLYRSAASSDALEVITLRGQTRENAVSVSGLASLGITVESWGKRIEAGNLSGHVCTHDGRIVGYCFGDKHTGEILVLALLPEYENRGIGRTLLSRVSEDLWSLGFKRLFLGCSRVPSSRSYDFYRHLGWRSTGAFDTHADEILELLRQDK